MLGLGLQAVSKHVRDLADLVLEEQFKARWGVAAIVAPPVAPPAFAAARPQFVLAHRLAGKESLPGLAVRYGTDVTFIKRLNNLLSDHAVQCRCAARLPATAPFYHCWHAKRPCRVSQAA